MRFQEIVIKAIFLAAFSLTNYFFFTVGKKRTSEQCHVTNDVIALRLIQEVVIIKGYFYTTKLFGIDDFSAAKDFGKVFIIIIIRLFFIIIIINMMKVQRFLQLLTKG